MKVLFIGAYGKVGQHFAEQLKNHPQIKEKALIRNPEQVPFFEEKGSRRYYWIWLPARLKRSQKQQTKLTLLFSVLVPAAKD